MPSQYAPPPGRYARPKSVGTDLKSPGTAPVSPSPPIVPAAAAESMAAGGLIQRWDGMRTGYAYDFFDRIKRLFNQRACACTEPELRSRVRFGPPTRTSQLRQSAPVTSAAACPTEPAGRTGCRRWLTGEQDGSGIAVSPLSPQLAGICLAVGNLRPRADESWTCQ